MLRGIRLITLTAAVIPALLLSACAPEPAATPAAPTVVETTQKPVFTTKEQAYTAAEKVYRRYLRISAKADADPRDYDRESFAGIASAAVIESESKALARVATAGLHGSGQPQLERFRGQRYEAFGPSVLAYVCVDFTATKILNNKTEDVTSKTRPSTRTSVASFVIEKGALVFDGQAAYAGNSAC